MARLVFIGALPMWGIQSGPVILRHLMRATAAWDVTCVHFTGDPPADYPLKTLRIPDRKRGWLPVRTWLPGSYQLRLSQWVAYVRQALSLTPDDRILCCLDNRDHEVSRRLSQATGAKLVVLLHDHWGTRLETRSVAKTLRQANRILTVSDGLAELARRLGGRAVSTMLPIGEDRLTITARDPAEGPVTLGVAGTMDAGYIRAARMIADKVVCLSAPIPGFEDDCCVTFTPRFPRNRDALAFLAQTCDALAIYQTFEPAPWLEYAFPSRLVDFAQTGLPIAMLAPEASNLGRWAQAHDWPLWLKDPTDLPARDALRRALDDPAVRALTAERVDELSRGAFAPQAIHRQLEAALGAP